MLGLGHGLPRGVWGRCLPLGLSLYQSPVRFMHPPAQDHTSDLCSFQLPNAVLPHASNKYTKFAGFATITKLSTCDNIFGALSIDGELFTFSPPEPKATSGGEKIAIKPQLVWALRKAFTAVKVSKGASKIASTPTLPVGFLSGSGWIHHPLHGIRSCFLGNKEP